MFRGDCREKDPRITDEALDSYWNRLVAFIYGELLTTFRLNVQKDGDTANPAGRRSENAKKERKRGRLRCSRAKTQTKEEEKRRSSHAATTQAQYCSSFKKKGKLTRRRGLSVKGKRAAVNKRS